MLDIADERLVGGETLKRSLPGQSVDVSDLSPSDPVASSISYSVMLKDSSKCQELVRRGEPCDVIGRAPYIVQCGL